MSAEPRFRWSLVLAGAAHAALGLGTLRSPASREAAEETRARASMAPEPTEIELESPPRAETSPYPAAPIEPARPTNPDGLARDERARSPREAPSGSSGASPEAPAPPSPEAASTDWTFSPTGAAPNGTLSSLDLRDAVRAAAQVTVAEGRARDAGARRLPGAIEQDLQNGLGAGGLLELTRNRVRISRVPSTSHALLEFRIDAKGAVTSVRVLDASSDWRLWEGVADELTEDARGHPLQVPADVGGLSLTFDITSSLRTVTGAPQTDSAVGKALRVINDPLGAATDSKSPAQRIVAVRVVAVEVY